MALRIHRQSRKELSRALCGRPSSASPWVAKSSSPEIGEDLPRIIDRENRGSSKERKRHVPHRTFCSLAKGKPPFLTLLSFCRKSVCSRRQRRPLLPISSPMRNLLPERPPGRVKKPPGEGGGKHRSDDVRRRPPWRPPDDPPIRAVEPAPNPNPFRGP